MTSASQISDALRSAFAAPAGGVVGAADNLLSVCRDYHLELDGDPSHCRFRSANHAWIELPAPWSPRVFRPLLARLAYVGNPKPDNAASISPYQFEREMNVGDPPVKFRISVVNTPASQTLRLAPQPLEQPAAKESQARRAVRAPQ
jgi:hypothetical protein